MQVLLRIIEEEEKEDKKKSEGSRKALHAYFTL